MADIRRDLLFSFLERYGNLIVSILSVVILARLLSPAETGLYSVAAGLINIAQSFREFGVGAYILQEGDLSRDKLASATGVCLTIATALAAGFFFGAGPIAAFYHSPDLMPVIRVLCLNFILVAFASIGSAQLRRDMRFRANMMVSLATISVGAVVSTGLAALGCGAISLAFGSLAGAMVTVFGNVLALGDRGLVWPSLRRWRDMVHFGLYSSGTGMLLILAERAPDLLVARLLSLEAAGLFSRGNGLITLFRLAITGAVDPVISGRLAIMHRENRDVDQALLHIVTCLSAVAWPALAVLALLAQPIIVIMFGEAWLASVPVAQILCAGTAASLIGNICQTYLASTGAVRSVFLVQVISVPAFVAAVALGSLVSLAGAAVGAAATSALITILSLEMVRRRIALDWPRIVRAVLPSLAITLMIALPLAGLVRLAGPDLHPWRTLILAAPTVALWLGSLHLVGHPLRHEVSLLAGWIKQKWSGRR